MTAVIDGGWRLLSSQRTTALLAILFSSAAFVAAIVPQGGEAIELARDRQAAVLHDLAAWGLTDVFASPFFKALGALLVGNLAAVALAGLRSGAGKANVEPPARAPLEKEIKTAFPEVALEIMREVFIPRLGQPSGQAVQGARVVMVFDSGGNTNLAPILTHLGLMFLVLGAGIHAASARDQAGITHAILEITDSQTKAVGRFDMVAGEPFTLFQFPSKYVLRDYSPAKEGQGPAVRIERTPPAGETPSDFWVYLNAPAGFDAEHRRGEVAFQAVKMGLSPLPGQGLADSSFAVLMIGGLAMMGVGAMKSGRAKGRLWIDTKGDVVRLAGVPAFLGDTDFANAFERWSLTAEAALSTDAS